MSKGDAVRQWASALPSSERTRVTGEIIGTKADAWLVDWAARQDAPTRARFLAELGKRLGQPHADRMAAAVARVQASASPVIRINGVHSDQFQATGKKPR